MVFRRLAVGGGALERVPSVWFPNSVAKSRARSFCPRDTNRNSRPFPWVQCQRAVWTVVDVAVVVFDDVADVAVLVVVLLVPQSAS